MKSKRLLFVGNSFTMGSGDQAVFDAGGVPFLVEELAAAAGMPRPDTRLCALGGRHFYEHLEDETGALSAIRQGGWDAVVLQEYSTFPTHAGDPDRFMTDGANLHREIRKANPQARTVLFETWARQAQHPMVNGSEADFEGGWRQMQAELNENYRTLTRTLGPAAILAPVGEAWERLLLQPDPLRLHADDNYHAGRNGSLTAAAVITRTLFDGLALKPSPRTTVPQPIAERIFAAVSQIEPFPAPAAGR